METDLIGRAMTRAGGQEGFTFIEIIVASLIMMLIVAAVIQYHASSGASKGQEFYLKAVQKAHSEMDRLRALHDLDSGCSEFESTGAAPGDLYLFRFTDPTSIEVPTPLFHVYYGDHGYSSEMLKSLGSNNTAKSYPGYYAATYNGLPPDDDTTDRKTFTFFTDDGNTATDSNPAGGQVDASIVVIDDMGSPGNPEDDLLGNIGWWVEDVVISGVTQVKKVTFALQFWYPGQEWTNVDPEVIVLKTTLVKP